MRWPPLGRGSAASRGWTALSRKWREACSRRAPLRPGELGVRLAPWPTLTPATRAPPSRTTSTMAAAWPPPACTSAWVRVPVSAAAPAALACPRGADLGLRESALRDRARGRAPVLWASREGPSGPRAGARSRAPPPERGGRSSFLQGWGASPLRALAWGSEPEPCCCDLVFFGVERGRGKRRQLKLASFYGKKGYFFPVKISLLCDHCDVHRNGVTSLDVSGLGGVNAFLVSPCVLCCILRLARERDLIYLVHYFLTAGPRTQNRFEYY